MKDQENIARILRVDRRVLTDLENLMNNATGKFGVISSIAEENEAILTEKLDILGLGRKSTTASGIYDALISKVESDDLAIFEALNRPSMNSPEDIKRIVDLAEKITAVGEGFFLRKEIAREFILKMPPPKMMDAFGYKSAEELLGKKDIFEIYASLRFLEDPVWLNETFFKQYENLKPSDFEKRKIEARPLSTDYIPVSMKFVKKKYHNLSHLKELGTLFVIPISIDVSGETLRTLTLLCHYFNEIKYYAELFEHYSKNEATFAKNVIALLRGDVIGERLPAFPEELRRARWLIVQRYLAKDDENDWRLFDPHVNPEALHWERAEKNLINIPKVLPNFRNGGIEFWNNLDFVGDHFRTEVGVDVLVSFDLIDTVMALVKEKEAIKYLYHHQEALWNKIFMSYLGEEELRKLIKENIHKGYFEL